MTLSATITLYLGLHIHEGMHCYILCLLISGMSGRKLRLSVHRKNERRAAHSLPVQIPMQDAGSFTPSSTFEDIPSESLGMLPVQIPLQDAGSFMPSSTFEDVPSESLAVQIPLQDVGSFTPSSTFEDVPSESLAMLHTRITACNILPQGS